MKQWSEMKERERLLLGNKKEEKVTWTMPTRVRGSEQTKMSWYTRTKASTGKPIGEELR